MDKKNLNNLNINNVEYNIVDDEAIHLDENSKPIKIASDGSGTWIAGALKVGGSLPTSEQARKVITEQEFDEVQI